MIFKRLAVLSLTVLLGTWFGLVSAAEVKHNDKIDVFVSIDPVAYFVKRVAGPLADVNVLVGPGQEPHTFEPTPKLVAKLAERAGAFQNRVSL